MTYQPSKASSNPLLIVGVPVLLVLGLPAAFIAYVAHIPPTQAEAPDGRTPER